MLVVFGTRPEAIKMAPVISAIRGLEKEFILQICVTGQHRKMLDQVLEIFNLHPDFDFNVMTTGQDLTDVCTSVLIEMRELFKSNKPDIVLVHGDTTTTMATALAAFYAGIPVGHVEAGLRTFDIHSPYPEELNRQVVSRIAKFHFAPTEECRKNLTRELVQNDSIWVTGNTVIDALRITLSRIHTDVALDAKIRKEIRKILSFDFSNSNYILITGHRRENFGDGFIEICSAIKELAEKFPFFHFVYPVHLNPNVQKPVTEMLEGIPNIHLIEPQDYLNFLVLLENCYFVITDSGGIQEEAPSLGKPVLVMREVTERPEAIAAGTVKLVGTNKAKLVTEVTQLIEDKNYYLSMSQAHNPYGDGFAAARIVEVLQSRI